MPSRRSFLAAPAAAAALSRSAVGASDRIRFAIVGAGTRGSHLGGIFASQPDCECVAVCDVYRPARDKVAAQMKGQPETYADYRKVLGRRDIDAVVIATPDHWHAQMVIEASQAGQDSYCEKPLSHTIEAGMKMREAVRRHKRVVQVGLQQRSWEHFQECARRVQEGMLGTVYMASCVYQGNYTRPSEQPTDPPADLDWELFQGPAPRRPYSPGRHRGWRAYYDYSGGTLTDWGTHLTHIAHWYLNATAPLAASGSGQYVRVTLGERDQLPDSVAVTWKYDEFVMTYTNTAMPAPGFDVQGNYFLGTRGWLQVNRTGYRWQPIATRGRPPGQVPPPFEPFSASFPYVGGPSDQAHVRNFLDCVRTRQDPVVDIDAGFFATLPTLMGVLAVRYEKTYAWTGTEAKPA
jgi:predicted dehydrogenase